LDERNVLINPDILPIRGNLGQGASESPRIGEICGLIKGKGIGMSEERLIDIEVKLAHQEHALDEVSQVLTDQQAQLSRLEQVCRSLAERLRSISEGTSAGEHDDKPPHY
jgi:SlyX protein